MRKTIKTIGLLTISSLFLLSSCQNEVSITEEEFFELIEKGKAQRIVDDFELNKFTLTMEVSGDLASTQKYVVDATDTNNYYYLYSVENSVMSITSEIKKVDGVYISTSILGEIEMSEEEVLSAIDDAIGIAYDAVDASVVIAAGSLEAYESVTFYKKGDEFGARFGNSENSEKGEFHINKYSFLTYYEFSGLDENQEERYAKMTATYN